MSLIGGSSAAGTVQMSLIGEAPAAELASMRLPAASCGPASPPMSQPEAIPGAPVSFFSDRRPSRAVPFAPMTAKDWRATVGIATRDLTRGRYAGSRHGGHPMADPRAVGSAALAAPHGR
jgi:hypothetical protein